MQSCGAERRVNVSKLSPRIRRSISRRGSARHQSRVSLPFSVTRRVIQAAETEGRVQKLQGCRAFFLSFFPSSVTLPTFHPAHSRASMFPAAYTCNSQSSRHLRRDTRPASFASASLSLLRHSKPSFSQPTRDSSARGTATGLKIPRGYRALLCRRLPRQRSLVYPGLNM